MKEESIEKTPAIKFHKDTFEKTTEDRRLRVIEVAIAEFAAKGYSATNINDIARKSKVSIGAMYSYFASKEDLFLAVVNRAYLLLETVLNEMNAKSRDIFEFVENMLKASREYAIQYPELNQIYLDLTTQGLSQMADRLSLQLETTTVQLYRQVIRKAKADGAIKQDLDENSVAFCIDNLLVMYQFSFSADYYKERLKIFLGREDGDFENFEKGIIDFVRKAIG